MKNALYFSAFIFLVSCQKKSGPPPPVDPVSLVATAISKNKIDLSWVDRSTNENEFIIERKNAGSSFTPITKVAKDVTVFTDSGLMKNTAYTYRVFASNDGGPSPSYTNEASATTFDDIPAAADNLITKANSYSQITLSWRDNAINETGYKVERKLPGGSFQVITTLAMNSNSYVDSGLIENTVYVYRVYPFNSGGNALFSNESADTTFPNLKDKLLAYYSFTGNTLDSSGNNLHGTGSIQYLTTNRVGAQGSAYFFDGMNSIGVSHDPRLDSLPLTISLWFNYLAAEQVSFNALISRYPRFSNKCWLIGLGSKIFPYYSNGYGGSIGGFGYGTFTLDNAGDGKWHHLAVVLHPESGGIIYFDGKKIVTEPWTGTPGIVTNFSSGMIFGYFPTYPTTPQSGHYIGKLDDIRIYNKVLDSLAIRYLAHH